MLYFKPDLIDLACQIVNSRETEDDVKTFVDLNKVLQVLQNYGQTGTYNPQKVTELDKKIRKDYPIIDVLYGLPSSKNHSGRTVNNIKQLPAEINALDVDRYGILITVLLKKGIVNDAKNVLE